MIIISQEHLKEFCDAAEAAYPNECCGMLAGSGEPDSALTITRVVHSTNVTEKSGRDSFEVDPKVRFDLMRALDNTEDTDERIIGHFHSHPDHPALPSETDLAMVYEPDLVWLITSVFEGQALETKAFQPKSDASGFAIGFTMLEIRTPEWHELPNRESQ